MQELNLNSPRMIYRAMSTLENGESLTIAISGWRKKLLVPYLCQLVPNADQIPQTIGVTRTTSFGWMIRSPWLPTLLTLCNFALDRKFRVSICHGEPAKLEFKNQSK